MVISTVIILLVAGMFAASIATKVRLYPSKPLYTSDAAMRYRYARMAAMNQPIPDIDTKVQAPEGLEVRSLILLFQDRTVGSSYRLLSKLKADLDFDSYLKWFVCIFSSLPVFAVFFAGSALWKSRLAGVVSASLWAVSVPAMERVLGNYLREAFALPFIFASFAFFVASVGSSESRRKANILGLLAGAFTFLSLSAWHLSGFYLLVFLGGASLAAFMRADLKPVQRPLVYVVAFSILAGAINTPLRNRVFLVSIPMMVGYCAVISYALFARFKMSRRAAAVVLLIMVMASVTLAASLSPRKGEYGHVYSLILSKARFLLDKPADPGRLPADARVLWLGPFQSPSLFSFLYGFVPLLAFTIYPAFRVIRKWARGLAEQNEGLLVLMSVGFLVLYVFVRRLEVFLVYFAVLLVGGMFANGGRKKVLVLAVAASALFFFEAYKSITFHQPTPLKEALLSIRRPVVESPSIHDRDKGEIFRQIRNYTPADAVFLARFATGPLVVTYGERASVLHSIFETREIREKVLECASAFYGMEEDLKRVCTKYGVDYVLYEANQLLDDSEIGERYLTNNLRLTTNCVAFLMHFAPQWLRYFIPVYQTDYFRVFRVREEPGANAPVLLGYSVQYDPSVFMVDRMGGVFSDSLVDEAWKSIEKAFGLAQKGNGLMSQGRYREAAEYFDRTLELIPGLEEVRLSLAESQRLSGRLDLSAATHKKMIEINPYNVGAYLNLATLYRQQDLLTMAAEVLEEGLALMPDNIYLMADLAGTNVDLGDTATAVAYYRRILEIDPSIEEARTALRLLE